MSNGSRQHEEQGVGGNHRGSPVEAVQLEYHRHITVTTTRRGCLRNQADWPGSETPCPSS